MNRVDLEKALQNPNLQKLLDVIGFYESSNRYDIGFSPESSKGRQLAATKEHPGFYKTADGKDYRNSKGQRHSASGRYMFTKATWNEMAKKYGLDNFSDPRQQDIAAVGLLAKMGGLDAALKGDFEKAFAAASSKGAWGASLTARGRTPIALAEEAVSGARNTAPRVVASTTPPLAPTPVAATTTANNIAVPSVDESQTLALLGDLIQKPLTGVNSQLVPGQPENSQLSPLEIFAKLQFGSEIQDTPDPKVYVPLSHREENAGDKYTNDFGWVNASEAPQSWLQDRFNVQTADPLIAQDRFLPPNSLVPPKQQEQTGIQDFMMSLQNLPEQVSDAVRTLKSSATEAVFGKADEEENKTSWPQSIVNSITNFLGK